MGLWKKITGLEKIERDRAAEEARLKKVMEEVAKAAAEEFERTQAREKAAEEAAAERDRLEQEAAFNKLDPKARATELGEPWVAVLETHVNKDDIRNGFFELDWNPLFVEKLILSGYGTEADPEEEIVDRWFRDIVSQMLAEEGLDPQSRGSGYINVAPLSKGRSEIS
jgi:hypothetical protein